MNEVKLKPIGIFFCSRNKKYELARQGSHADDEVGWIELEKDIHFNQATKRLDEFSHLWVIYLFNNRTWKDMVAPPTVDFKVGVFASRSPYRPSPIGISALEIVKIENKKIYVKKFDLLNETIILDIKPYLKNSDSFPRAKPGWTKHQVANQIFFSKNWLNSVPEKLQSNLKLFINQQLQYHPDSKSKRVRWLTTNEFKEFNQSFFSKKSIKIPKLLNAKTLDDLKFGSIAYKKSRVFFVKFDNKIFISSTFFVES